MVTDMQSLGQKYVKQQRRDLMQQIAVRLVQALTMITATLGFNCPKNVLMLGRKCEGVGNSVACTTHTVKHLSTIMNKSRAAPNSASVRFLADFCTEQRMLLC